MKQAENLDRLWTVLSGDNDLTVDVLVDVLSGDMIQIDRDSIPECLPPSFSLESVILDGFGPHNGPNELHLSGGLNLLEGDNGAGKTHVLLAVNWSIFGNRGSLDPWMMKQDPFGMNLVNWNRSLDQGGRMSVEVAFEWNGRRFRTRRTLDKNGQESSYFMEENGKWMRSEGIPFGLDPDIIPFFLFQGEAVMYLSTEGQMAGEGRLGSALSAISGVSQYEHFRERLYFARSTIITNLETGLEKGLPLEKEIQRLEGKKEVLNNEGKELIHDIQRLETSRDSSLKRYRSALKKLARIGSLTSKQKDSITARARLPGLKTELQEFLSGSAREILRNEAERALRKAVAARNEHTRKRILCGAYDAQLSIVNQVLDTRKCICGTSIGRTGMGRERLKSLMGRLEAKRKEVLVDASLPAWIGDHVVESVERSLGKRTIGGNDIRRNVRSILKDERKAVLIETEEKGSPNDLLDVIRDHERTTIELASREEELRAIDRKIDKVDSKLKLKGSELASIWGEKRTSNVLATVLERMDKIIQILDLTKEDRIQEFIKRLEDDVNRMLNESEKESWISRFKIHRNNFIIGIEREEQGRSRTVTMPFLSAGEREAVASLIVIAISRITGSGLVLDSPFPYMDKGYRTIVLDLLTLLPGKVLLTIPTGTMGGRDIEDLERRWNTIDREFVHYHLKGASNGTMIEKRGDPNG